MNKEQDVWNDKTPAEPGWPLGVKKMSIGATAKWGHDRKNFVYFDGVKLATKEELHLTKTQLALAWITALSALLAALATIALAVNVWAGEPGDRVQARVVRVVDGDTVDVEVQGLRARVRLLGVDAPERGQPGAVEATALLTRLVLDKDVILERDLAPLDPFGRNLSWVWTLDGQFVQALLVRAGVAQKKIYPPNKAHAHEIQP